MTTQSNGSTACKGATMLDGLALYGHEAQNDRPGTKKKVQTWLSKLGF